MKCQVLIDWLTFSIKNTEDPAQVIQKYLGLDPSLFQEAPYGLMGYQRVLRFGDIQVLYDPRENEYFHDMGVCVNMSGNGCRAFETMSRLAIKGAKDTQGTPSTAFPTLFQLLAAEGENANISRIDIACDDREGYLCMDDIIRAVQENTINSRMMKRTLYLGYDGIDRSGTTAYIGAESSSFRVRIYDKALERGESGHWIRVELVMKGENAQAFGQKLTNAESVGKLAAQVINDKFSFIIRDDTNITRCTVCPWWQAFVDELESVRLVARETVQHCVEHIASWVEAQVGPSLSILFQTMGWPKIFELAKEASERLSDKQRFLIADYELRQLVREPDGADVILRRHSSILPCIFDSFQLFRQGNDICDFILIKPWPLLAVYPSEDQGGFYCAKLVCGQVQFIHGALLSGLCPFPR